MKRTIAITILLCSTPYGIIGIHTSGRTTTVHEYILCSTPYGIIGIHTRAEADGESLTLSAQRLTASSEFTPVSWRETITETAGAQRLTASSEFTPVAGTFFDTTSRCSTPYGIIGIHTKQRFVKGKTPLWCSTPYGIIGIHTFG